MGTGQTKRARAVFAARPARRTALSGARRDIDLNKMAYSRPFQKKRDFWRFEAEIRRLDAVIASI